jgi:hypothetical protein
VCQWVQVMKAAMKSMGSGFSAGEWSSGTLPPFIRRLCSMLNSYPNFFASMHCHQNFESTIHIDIVEKAEWEIPGLFRSSG